MTTDIGRSTYQQVEVSGATGLQLVVMLYEGAIRFLGEAKSCIQRNDLSGKAVAIDRALAIVGELQSTLKRDEGGEVAQSLDRLYTYINERILEASLKLNSRPIDEVVKLLRILNSGWTEIARKPELSHMGSARVSGLVDQAVDRRASGPLELFG